MKTVVLFFIINMALITHTLPLEEEFTLNPDSYVAFDVNVEKGINYWIEINSSDSYQLFFVNQNNFDLFREKEDFFP